MRLQIYAQHYAPEVTAARYRVEAFVQRFVPRGHEVEVICPVPNQPLGEIAPDFRGRAVVRREVDGASVRYVWVRASPAKTKRARLEYYGSYTAMATAVGLASRRPDLILASSPPLSVGAAAATVARLRRVPWVLDVRDLWPRAALLIGELSEGRALRAAERLERGLYRSATAIVTVTRPFAAEIAALAGDSKVNLIPNGTTRAWLEAGGAEPRRADLGLAEDRFIWTYAGNLGPSRRLDVAIEAARALGDRFQLLILGDGGARRELERLASELPEGSVRFLGVVPAERAAVLLRASDAGFVPQQRSLGDFVPSKLYDCAAVGRPLVVAAVGETARLTRDADIGLVADPDSPAEVATAVSRLAEDGELAGAMVANGRRFAEAHLRERQGDALVDLAERLVAVRGR